jgi:hypothetical protein
MVHCGNTGISGVFDGFGRFTPVSDCITKNGSFMQYPPDKITPAMVQAERLVGTFTLPLPVTGTHTLGYAVLFCCLAGICCIEFRCGRHPKTPKIEMKQ